MIFIANNHVFYRTPSCFLSQTIIFFIVHHHIFYRTPSCILSYSNKIKKLNLLRESFLPDIKEEYHELIRRIIKELDDLGDDDLEREPWWPSKTGLWLQTGFESDLFLKNKVIFLLWSMELKELDISAIGSNQIPLIDEGHFRYSFWKDYYLNPAFIHIFYSQSHFYLYDGDVNYLRNEFYSALDNLVDNLLVFLTDEYN